MVPPEHDRAVACILNMTPHPATIRAGTYLGTLEPVQQLAEDTNPDETGTEEEATSPSVTPDPPSTVRAITPADPATAASPPVPISERAPPTPFGEVPPAEDPAGPTLHLDTRGMRNGIRKDRR
jgi:hypothetical protein